MFRMNMPFEFGLDFGLRHSGKAPFQQKKFLVFESQRYDLKAALSDFAGQDVEAHNNQYQTAISKVRDFFAIEAAIRGPGPTLISSKYESFLGWLIDKKISEGHSEAESLNLPVAEHIDEILDWLDREQPEKFY